MDRVTIFLLPWELTKTAGHEKVGVDSADHVGKAETIGREKDLFAANSAFLPRGKANRETAGTRTQI
jgi:hypothetical protein